MTAAVRREKLTIGANICVTVEADRPAGHEPGRSPALVVAPGAGSDLDTPFLVELCRGLSESVLTVRFNFPYREAGRGGPDPQPRLEATYRWVLAWLRADPELRPGPLLAGGKSMGGRIATHLAAAGEPLAGLVLLGYPLHPPGQPGRLRDVHLPAVRCPMLFVQGSRDSLCDLGLLRPVLARLAAPHHLHVIEGGDHSFKTPKRAGRSDAGIQAEILDVVRRFVGEAASRPTG